MKNYVRNTNKVDEKLVAKPVAKPTKAVARQPLRFAVKTPV